MYNVKGTIYNDFDGYLNSMKCKPQLYAVNCKLYIEATGGSILSFGKMKELIDIILPTKSTDSEGFSANHD